MGKIIRAEDLPEGENVYLRKDFLGWRVVEPLKNENGKINWFNTLVGGKKGIAFLIVILILSGAFYLGVSELISNYKQVADHPCNFCKTCQTYVTDTIANLNLQIQKNSVGEIHFSDLNFTG